MPSRNDVDDSQMEKVLRALQEVKESNEEIRRENKCVLQVRKTFSRPVNAFLKLSE